MTNSTKSLKTIAEYWDIFEAITISEDAGEEQRLAMKVSFFAGAVSMMHCIAEDDADIEAVMVKWLNFARELKTLHPKKDPTHPTQA